MKYRVEYHDHDRNLVTIHLDLDLLLFLPKPVKNWLASTEDDGEYDRDENVPHFVKRLILLKGIADVTYGRYSIDLIKGDFSSWRSIIPVVIGDLEMVLNHGEAARHVRKRHSAVPKKKVMTHD